MNGLSKKELSRVRNYGSRAKSESKEVVRNLRTSHPFTSTDENKELLEACWRDWENMSAIREEHRRNQRYKNNKQWEDLVPDPENPDKLITERKKISRTGRTPLSNNLIDPTVRNIHGQMLSNPTQPVVICRSEDDLQLGEMLTNTLQKALKLNKYNVLKTSAMESLLSSGYVIGKVRFGHWHNKNRTDVKLDFISINRFFFNQDAEDPRLNDICRCGEIHDLSWQQLVRDFNIMKDDEEAVKQEYAASRPDPTWQSTAESNINNLDFLGVANLGKYRVFEVWVKMNRQVEYVHDPVRGEELYDEVHDSKYYQEENRLRREQMESLGMAEDEILSNLIQHKSIIEEYWEGRWLTPRGSCLKKMETPFEHQDHPYVIVPMPRIDGVSRPVLSNLCEIQRTANRHLTMIDFALAQSAKGLLLVPKSVLGTTSLEDFKEAWSRTDAAIEYDDTNPNSKMPTQISTNPIPVGAFDFLRTEWEALKEVSGLSGALQGQVANPNTPASLYAQQAQNSVLNLVLVFECLREFNTQMSEKTLQVIMQYYTSRRHVDISGKSFDKIAQYYEPEMVKKIIEWNIVIDDATDTPIFRQVADDFLKSLFEAQAISLEMLLENTTMPFAKKLLMQIQSAKQQAQLSGDWTQAAQGVQMDNVGQQPSAQSMAATQQLFNMPSNPNMVA